QLQAEHQRLQPLRAKRGSPPVQRKPARGKVRAVVVIECDGSRDQDRPEHEQIDRPHGEAQHGPRPHHGAVRLAPRAPVSSSRTITLASSTAPIAEPTDQSSSSSMKRRIMVAMTSVVGPPRMAGVAYALMAMAKVSRKPPAMPGAVNGRVTDRKVRARPAPRLLAACSSAGFSAFSDAM